MNTQGDFYRAFEDRHRGTSHGVQERQRAYLPFLAALRDESESPTLVDLGCGRGEWLSLARAEGWRTQGVDVDSAMLQAARDAGHDVHEGDATAHLRALPAASCGAVSAFHLVEHLAFDPLRALLAEAARVLRPGGLLIVETPNPENLVVGSSAFHMDPTHVRPLPPALLAFAVEFAGFDRVSVLRLHEGLDESRPVELIDVLAGVSPDYAIVARTPGGVDAPGMQALFAGFQGVTLNDLADSYDAQLREIRVFAELAREAALQLDYTQREQNSRLQALEAGAALLNETAQASVPLRDRVLQVREHIGALEYKVAAMEASTSWRVTSPLRRAGDIRIRIANNMHSVLEGVPALHRCARAIARMLRLVPRGGDATPAPMIAATQPSPAQPSPSAQLTAPARRVYDAMEEARTPQGSKET